MLFDWETHYLRKKNEKSDDIIEIVVGIVVALLFFLGSAL